VSDHRICGGDGTLARTHPAKPMQSLRWLQVVAERRARPSSGERGSWAKDDDRQCPVRVAVAARTREAEQSTSSVLPTGARDTGGLRYDAFWHAGAAHGRVGHGVGLT